VASARIVDEEEESLKPEETPQQEIEFDENPPQEETQEPEVDEEKELPEKYQGKSIQDIVRMHQEAEKVLGRQSSEVGELRRTVDTYIQKQLSNETTPEESEDVDFFADPKAAINSAIENHPKIKQAESAALGHQRELAVNALKNKHPDADAIVQDPKFGEYVQASNMRMKLWNLADQAYDMDAADELFTNWKERKGVVEKTVELEKVEKANTIKKASTGNIRGTGETSKKVYRRTDIIRLMKDDPARYEANADEIMQAYKEGRVK